MTADKEMQNKDHNECPFSDEIVSYIYGEMPDSAQAKFEQHIATCQVCTDDFAAVSLARFETYDWKKVEFDPLETPRMAIPYKEKAVSLGERVSAWMSWVTVAPAVAVVLIAIGSVVFYFRNTSVTTVAVQAPKVAAVAPPVEKPVAAPELALTGTKSKNSVVRPQTASLKRRPALPKAQVARRVTPGVKLGNDLAINIASDPVKRSPRLGMTDPDDDRSLRLTDLFDETNPPPQER